VADALQAHCAHQAQRCKRGSKCGIETERASELAMEGASSSPGMKTAVRVRGWLLSVTHSMRMQLSGCEWLCYGPLLFARSRRKSFSADGSLVMSVAWSPSW
jgi:hypothetical protein